MKTLIKILCYLLGGIFVFSGFVKLVDPAGTAIKLEEYFTAFSSISLFYNINFLSSLFLWLHEITTPLSIVISTLEITLGFALIFNYKLKTISRFTFLLLVFFGFLTGYSATCDPSNEYGVSCVTDCGCFGDFLPLKPIESFYKDLILLAFCLPILLWTFNKNTSKKQNRTLSISILIIASACVFFGIYTINSLPLLDFRPYKIGNNIIELRKNGKPAEIAYIMSKDGQEESFSKYPYDQGYEFVSTKTIVETVPPTAKDFYLYDSTGNDITEAVLKGHYIWVVSKDITQITLDDAQKLNDILLNKGSKEIICLTSSSKEEFIDKKIEVANFKDFYNLDQTVIKAIIRTNPGILEAKEGTILNKWTLSHFQKTHTR